MTVVVDGVTIRTSLDVAAAYAGTVGATPGGVQVATKPTPLTPAQALGGLLAAGCPQSALLMVAAQSSVETNAWGSTNGKGFNNFNFGNVTPSTGQLNAGAQWMSQGIAGMKYLSFSDPISGAKAMLGWLSARGLLARASANDLAGYMALLQSGCYLGCIGNTDPTGHTVSSTDYANYQAGISSRIAALSKVTPVAPPMPNGFWQNALIAAAGLTVAGAVAVAVYDVVHHRPVFHALRS